MAAFPDGVKWVLEPSGPSLTIDAGPLQARIFEDTGHIQLVGPDMAGVASANVITLAPPAVRTAAGPAVFGRIVSSSTIAGGLAVRQAVGTAQIDAQLTFVARGRAALRGHRLGRAGSRWRPPSPGLARAASTSTGSARSSTRSTKPVGASSVLTFDDPGTKNDHSYKVGALVRQHARLRLAPGLLGREHLRHAGRGQRTASSSRTISRRCA